MKQQPVDTQTDRAFLPTVPPSVETDPRLTAALLATLGIETVRASLIDLGSMSSRLNWNVDEHGNADRDSGHSGHDSQFRTTMATIVQLKDTPASETLTRRLDPRRWAFAWRIDEGRVAVAEACYRLAHIEHSEDDTALLRQICDDGLHVVSIGTGPKADNISRAMALDITTRDEEAESQSAPRDEVLSQQPASRVASRGNSRRSPAANVLLRGGMLALLLLCLGAAAVFVVAHRQADSMQGETLRLRAQAEATIGTRLGEVLAGGDYGEVQAELESFAALKYFEGAVVTNARGRVVAIVGGVKGVRMGDVVAPEIANEARRISLASREPGADAAVLTWGSPGPQVAPLGSQRSLLIVGFLLSVAAVAATAWLLIRSRRPIQARE